MSSQCPAVPGDLTLQQLVDEHVLIGSRRCFLVTRGQDTVGLMTLHRIKEVPVANGRRRVSPRSCFPWNSRNEPTLTRSYGLLSNRWTAMESISCQSRGITR
jgi:hypothetical protein